MHDDDEQDDLDGGEENDTLEEAMRLRMRLVECETEIGSLKATIDRQRVLLQILQATVMQQTEGAACGPETDDDDLPPLVLAAREGNPEMVLAVVSAGAIQSPAIVDAALQTACQHGRVEAAAILIDRVNADVHADHDNALIWACHRGCVDLVTLLLDRGACLGALNDLPMRIAVRMGHVGVVEVLGQAKKKTPSM